MSKVKGKIEYDCPDCGLTFHRASVQNSTCSDCGGAGKRKNRCKECGKEEGLIKYHCVIICEECLIDKGVFRNLWKCKDCGEEFYEWANTAGICPKCKTKTTLKKRTCPTCGKESFNGGNKGYCNDCKYTQGVKKKRKKAEDDVDYYKHMRNGSADWDNFPGWVGEIEDEKVRHAVKCTWHVNPEMAKDLGGSKDYEELVLRRRDWLKKELEMGIYREMALAMEVIHGK